MSQQLLDGADIVTGFQQMGSKAVPTGIFTLLINRKAFKFTTLTIPNKAT
jgi:hypothetical protein